MTDTILDTLFDFSAVDRLPAQPAGRGRLRRAQSASGPALLFVHGAYHGAWCYAHYLDFFAGQNIACAALDLPGHGGLPQDADFPLLGVHDLAEAVAQACDLLPGPAVVVGHSMGALPALLGACARQVAGVVLLAPSPPANVPGAQALPPVAPIDRPRQPPAPQEIRQRFLAAAPDADVSAVMQRLCPESPAVLNDRYLLRVPIQPQALAGVPGLCLEAGLDTSDRHPPGQDRALADFLGFEHRLLDKHPHCMMYGPRWRDSAQAILDWYRARIARSATQQ